ncbi:sensor histidine kinase [Candidatus Enterococcus ferrettii]|nr:HAMP domain-containing sensor histidine kinase [Enterococcus sp. 665A]
MSYPKNSLTRRFIQRIALIFIVAAIFFGLFYRWIFPTYYYWKMEQPVKQAQEMIQQGKEPVLSEDLVLLHLDIESINSEEEVTNDLSFRLNQNGISLNRFWVDTTTLNALKEGRSVQRLYNQTKQKNDFYTIFLVQDQTLYMIGTSIPDFKAAIQVLLPILVATTLVFLLLLFGLIVLLVRKQIIKPIGRLEQATSSISNLNFADSDIQEENELGSLSQSINHMKRSLQQHEMEMLARNDQLKTFSANLAHELKTPLSIIQLLVDSEEMGLKSPTFLADINQQLMNMNELVTQILAYSQQLKEEIQLEPVAIEPLLDKKLKQQQVIDPNFKMVMDVEAGVLQTNEALLEIVVLNLVTNGLKYSTDKQLKISGKQQSAKYVLTFENSAAPLAPQQFAQLTNPFVVGEQSRNHHLSGTGLGLSLVEQSLKSLGGELILQQKAGKFVARVILPLK